MSESVILESVSQHFLCITLSEAAKGQITKTLGYYLKCLRHSEVISADNYSDVRAISPAQHQLVVAELKNKSSSKLMRKEARAIPFGNTFSRVFSNGVKLMKKSLVIGLDMKLEGSAVSELESSLTSANVSPSDVVTYLFIPLFQAATPVLAEEIFKVLTSQYQGITWYWSASQISIRKGDYVDSNIASIWINTGVILKCYQDFSVWIPAESETELDLAVDHTLTACQFSCCTDENRLPMDFSSKIKYYCALKNLPLQANTGFIKQTNKYDFTDDSTTLLPEDISIISVNSNMGALVESGSEKIFRSALKPVLEQDRLKNYLRNLDEKKEKDAKKPLANLQTEKKAVGGINTRVESSLTVEEINFFKQKYVQDMTRDKNDSNPADYELSITDKVTELSLADKESNTRASKFHTADDSFNIRYNYPAFSNQFLNGTLNEVFQSTMKPIPATTQSQSIGVLEVVGPKFDITPSRIVLNKKATNDGSPVLPQRSEMSNTKDMPITSGHVNQVKKNLESAAMRKLTDTPPVNPGTSDAPAVTSQTTSGDNTNVTESRPAPVISSTEGTPEIEEIKLQ